MAVKIQRAEKSRIEIELTTTLKVVVGHESPATVPNLSELVEQITEADRAHLITKIRVAAQKLLDGKTVEQIMKEDI